MNSALSWEPESGQWGSVGGMDCYGQCLSATSREPRNRVGTWTLLEAVHQAADRAATSGSAEPCKAF